MATQIGKYVKVSTINETTYGNSSAMLAYTYFKPIRVKSISFPVDRGLLIEENIDGFIPTAAYGGALKVSGSLEGYLRPKQMEILFYSLFGASAALTATDPITSGYKYTLASPLPLQLKIGESTTAATTYDLELGYMGVGIKNCTLTFNPKELATAKFDWFAKIYSAASPFSPPAQSEYVTEEPITFYNATVSFAGSATAMTTIKSMTISVDRKTDEDRYIIGDYTLQELSINGMTEVSGDITFTEKEYTQFRNAIFGTSPSVNILDTEDKVSDQAMLVVMTDIAASETRKMYVKFGSVVFGSTDTTLNGNNEIEKKVSWKAVGSTFEFGVSTSA